MWIEKKSKIHGIGIIASENIKKGTKVIQYLGEKVSKREGDKRSAERIKKYLNKRNEGSVYVFELNKKYDIDGSPLYNKARYINHSCSPNCEVEIIKNEIWIVTNKKIIKGDELSYDYGYPFDEEDFLDHICKCGSSKCIGYIISKDEWSRYKKYKKNMTKNLSKGILKNKENIIKKSNILCIGDIILDHYIYGKVERISPEAPIPILSFKEENYQLGGVGNVAKNLSSLGAKCSLVSLTGNDFSSKKINKLLLLEKNIKQVKVKNNNFITPIKTRYINKLGHLLRVDREDTKFKIKDNFKKKLFTILNKEIKKSDLIILSDYNKGFLDEYLIKKIVKLGKKYNKMIIADPKKNNLKAYSGIDIITPNQKEISDAAGRVLKNEKEIISFARMIIKKYDIKEILLTRSEKGMLLIGHDYSIKFKANAKKVLDVTGAGDTVISVLALMKSLQIDTISSSEISNHAAGIIIGKRGTASLSYKELVS